MRLRVIRTLSTPSRTRRPWRRRGGVGTFAVAALTISSLLATATASTAATLEAASGPRNAALDAALSRLESALVSPLAALPNALPKLAPAPGMTMTGPPSIVPGGRATLTVSRAGGSFALGVVNTSGRLQITSKKPVGNLFWFDATIDATNTVRMTNAPTSFTPVSVNAPGWAVTYLRFGAWYAAPTAIPTGSPSQFTFRRGADSMTFAVNSWGKAPITATRTAGTPTTAATRLSVLPTGAMTLVGAPAAPVGPSRGTLLTWAPNPTITDPLYDLAWSRTPDLSRATVVKTTTATIATGIIFVWVVPYNGVGARVGPFRVNNCGVSDAAAPPSLWRIQTTARCEIIITLNSPSTPTPAAPWTFADFPPSTHVYLTTIGPEVLLGTIDGPGDLDPAPRRGKFAAGAKWPDLRRNVPSGGIVAALRFSMPGNVLNDTQTFVTMKADAAHIFLYLGRPDPLRLDTLRPLWAGTGVTLSTRSVTWAPSGLSIVAHPVNATEMYLQDGAGLEKLPSDYLADAQSALVRWDAARRALVEHLATEPTTFASASGSMAASTGQWVGKFEADFAAYVESSTPLLDYLANLPASGTSATAQMWSFLHAAYSNQETPAKYAELIDLITSDPNTFQTSGTNKLIEAIKNIKKMTRWEKKNEQLSDVIMILSIVGSFFGLGFGVFDAIKNVRGASDQLLRLSSMRSNKGAQNTTENATQNIQTAANSTAVSSIMTNVKSRFLTSWVYVKNSLALLSQTSDRLSYIILLTKNPAPAAVTTALDAVEYVKWIQPIFAADSRGVVKQASPAVIVDGRPMTWNGAVRELYLTKPDLFSFDIPGNQTVGPAPGGLPTMDAACAELKHKVESVIAVNGRFDRLFSREYVFTKTMNTGGPNATGLCKARVVFAPKDA